MYTASDLESFKVFNLLAALRIQIKFSNATKLGAN